MELPGRRGCSVIRGSPRRLSTFPPVFSNKAPFGLSPVGFELHSCDGFINILWPKYVFLVQVCGAWLKVDNTHIDRACVTKHRSTGVGFDICSYRGDWFNIPLYLEGIAPLCSVSYSTYKEYVYGISLCVRKVCVLQAGTRCNINVTIITPSLFGVILLSPFLLK